MLNEAKINLTTLTYRQLKELVPETPRGKMTAKKLEGKEILFEEMVHGARIRIFKNGYLTYTKFSENGTPHGTVYSVHRCKQIVFQVGFSTEERNEGWDYSALADEISYRIVDGQLTRFNIVKEKHYIDGPWWSPIAIICEERIRHNADSREEYNTAFSLDETAENDEGEETSENWNPELSCDPISDWIEAEDKKEKDKRNHETLMVAMKSLTDIQRRTVDLYYSNPGATTRALGKEMGVDHTTFMRNLEGALKKLRKFF